MGNVQSFIAQARSTRDLWSGSYLLSWLIAHAMKAITDELGPDAIIFPSLKGNGVFDALHKDDMYASTYQDKKGEERTLWERMCEDYEKPDNLKSWLCTPTLPNRFLALVPLSRAEKLAEAASKAVRTELVKHIGDAVWKWIVKFIENSDDKEWKASIDTAAWETRWNAQIEAFPQTAYAIQSWLDREKCLEALKELPEPADDESKGAYKIFKTFLEFAEKDEVRKRFSDSDRARYYNDDGTLKDSGILWSAHYALLDAKLAARRNTRNFDAWNSDSNKSSKDQLSSIKDSLSGVEECIGDEKFWGKLYDKENEEYKRLFKAESHRYGAMNLIKHLWCHPNIKTPYLSKELGIPDGLFNELMSFDSVPKIAERNKIQKGEFDKKSKNPYVAILAFDGDEMGKWVSGAKLPKLIDDQVAQVSQKAREYLEKLPDSQNIYRLLSPSYHLQFSEALANFATKEAEKIVKKHGGQLIYAGGDDVLAMLPATKAIECARELRNTFRKSYSDDKDNKNDKKYILPGNRMDVSVGLAIGHFKTPLQMLVREAQAAEKRAKSVYGRAAFAVSLYKRSGEIIHWGTKWDSNAIDLMEMLTILNEHEIISGRFPYALAALLKPYQLQNKNELIESYMGKTKGSSMAEAEEYAKNFVDEMIPVIKLEIEHVLDHQVIIPSNEKEKNKKLEELNADKELKRLLKREGDFKDIKEEVSSELRKMIEDYLKYASDKLKDFINLFMTETFINRNREGGDNA